MSVSNTVIYEIPKSDFVPTVPTVFEHDLTWQVFPPKSNEVAQLRLKLAQMQHELDQAKAAYKQLEQQYQQANQEREQLKGFLATAAHEIKNPLNVAMGFTTFLQQGKTGPVTAQQQDFLDSVATGLEEAKTLVEDLLSVDQLQRGVRKLEVMPVDLKKLTRQVMARFKLMAEAANVQLEAVNLDGTECQVLGAPNRIGQCLYNLILNALKFSPRGGTVKVEICETATGSMVKVIDNGPGISLENQKKLFQRYFQVKDEVGHHLAGYGLGLSITKELIERQNGQIGVESTPGAGSCFWFSLPEVALAAERKVA